MTQERDAIISRIRKLKAMSQANGASENEANMAMGLLAKLMAEYNIEQTELTLKQDAHGCIKDSFTAISGLDLWTEACWPIGKLFNCKVWRSPSTLEIDADFSISTIEMNFYGYPQDVEACLALCQIIYLAIGQETNRFIATQPKGKSRAKKEAIHSFSYGMAARINERINDLLPPPAGASQGRGLMVLKDQIVTDKFAEYCRINDLRLGRAASIHITNPAAFHSGRAAGSNVDLQRSAKVGSGPLRIGAR